MSLPGTNVFHILFWIGQFAAFAGSFDHWLLGSGSGGCVQSVLALLVSL